MGGLRAPILTRPFFMRFRGLTRPRREMDHPLGIRDSGCVDLCIFIRRRGGKVAFTSMI